ncbi:MAG: hypothetical protein AAGI11_18155 [Pseudomonadota bacterium]
MRTASGLSIAASLTANIRVNIAAIIAATLVLLPAAVNAQPSRAEMDALGKECEKQREEALAPVRAQRAQDCKDQQLRSPDHCDRYYQSYGNVGLAGGIGMGRQGLYYDLPVCQDWLKARDAAQATGR